MSPEIRILTATSIVVSIILIIRYISIPMYKWLKKQWEYINTMEVYINHPHAKEGEVFICILQPESLSHIGWKTKRLGPSTNQEGMRRGEETYQPLFVKEEELIKAGRILIKKEW
jgi:hypothetical protein